jgi:VWFA-related protein
MKIGNVAVTLFLAAAPALLAQNETFFSEVLEVRVTNVDVIVTGRDGKPVTGLTREDFELYENGVRKEISNFLELRGGPTATLTEVPATATAAPVPSSQDIRRRDITIFVDNSVLHPGRRNQILARLDEFVRKNVRGGDSVSIAVWSPSLKIALEPTSDRAAIDAALEGLKPATTASAFAAQRKEQFYQQIALLIRAYAEKIRPPGAPPEKPPWAMGINEARSYAMNASHEMKQRLEALKSVIAWRRGVEGRKILVLLTGEIPMNPAEEVFHYLDGMRDSFENPVGSAVSEASEYRVNSLIDDITSAANSAGVTLYPIDAAGKDSGMIDRGADANVHVTSGGTIAQANMMPTLRSIAAETGGVAMTGSDNWKLAFDTISNDLETYYSLGYRSEGARQDRMKNIEVKLKNKRHNVRTRKAVIEKSIESEMHDAVAANLFRPSATNDMGIKAKAGASTPKDEENVLIPVTVTIPMDKLTLVPEGTDLTARFAIYAAFLRKDGAVSKVAQQPGAVRFPAESLKRRKELTVKMDVTADTRTNGVSVGVMDELSRATGFAAVKLE